jgi:hypothetical protein
MLRRQTDIGGRHFCGNRPKILSARLDIRSVTL